jgi:uroporphyrinogen-III synthase
MSRYTLYLGTNPSFISKDPTLLHYPVIRLLPKTEMDEKVQSSLQKLSSYSCILLTSKNAVWMLLSLLKKLDLSKDALERKCLSIGPSTSFALRQEGLEPFLEATESTQEGMIAVLEEYISKDSHLFYPKSSLARPLLKTYLQENYVHLEVLDLYDVAFQKPFALPSLAHIRKIIFTSPSTVRGFFQILQKIPSDIELEFQGWVTQQAFEEVYNPSLEGPT